jgi:hypothetical protein
MSRPDETMIGSQNSSITLQEEDERVLYVRFSAQFRGGATDDLSMNSG